MRWVKIVAVQAVVAALLLEVAFRIYHPLPFRLRGNSIVLPVGLRYQFDNRGNPKLDPTTIHTRNALGFRGPELPDDSTSRLTIIAVGGSTTECFPLSDGRTWPDVMGAELAKTRSVWVNNAGLDGHSTVGHLALLREVLVPLRPKLMLVLAGLNDVGLDAMRPEDEVSALYPYLRPFWHRLALHSELVNTLVNLRRAAHARSIGYDHEPMQVATHRRMHLTDAEIAALVAKYTQHVERYGERLTAIVREARAAGIEPILITQPSLAGDAVDPTTGAQLSTLVEHADRNGLAEWRILEVYNDTMRAVGSRERAGLIDLARLMPKDSRYFYDLYHFGNEGAAAAGKIVAAQLQPLLVR